MKKVLVWTCILFAFIACNDDDDKVTVIELQDDKAYTFIVRVTGQWTSETHPSYFPSDAGFGEVLAIVHRDYNLLFKEGDKSKEWLKTYLNNGDSAPFISYYEEYKTTDKVSAIKTAVEFSNKSYTEFEFTTDANHDKLSLLLKLKPSPDWFLGINNIDLNSLANGGSKIYLIPVMDAGINASEGTDLIAEDKNITYKIGAPLNYPGGGVNSFARVTIQFKSAK